MFLHLKPESKPEPKPEKKTASSSTVLAVLLGVLMLGALISNLMSPSSSYTAPQSTPISSKYEARWNTDFHLGIAKALAKNNITDCGEFKYKARTGSSGEYIVKGTRDGKTWNSYLVWTGIDKVMGPYTPDPTLE